MELRLNDVAVSESRARDDQDSRDRSAKLTKEL